MSQENVELARRGFELWNTAVEDSDSARSRAALAEMIEMYHPDAALDYSRTLPDFPPAEGRDAIRAWTEDTQGVFTDVHFEPVEYLDAGDSVVVPVRVTARGASGATVAAEMVYVYRFQHQRVISATGFQDLAEALEAVGLEE